MNTAVRPPKGTLTTSTLSGGSGGRHIGPAVSTASKTMRWLTLAAVIGPILFTLAWIVLGFVSPGYTAWGIRFAPYSPIVQPVSGLGLGPTAPFMNIAFLLYGAALLVGAVGIFQTIREIGPIARWTCTGLFALSAVGAMLDGIFTLQTFLPHFIGFGLACGATVLGFLVTGFVLRGAPRWRPFGSWLLLASPLTVVLLVLSLVTFNQSAIEAGQGIAGLTERILILEIVAWYVALGWVAFRRA